MRLTVKLWEICEIERWGSPRPIQEFLTTDENWINWIKIWDTKTQPKYIEFTQEKIKPEWVKRSRMVYPWDFILSNSMSFGRPYIMKTSWCIHDWRLVLRPDNRIDKEFLYYLLGSNFMYKKFENSASWTGVKNLNIDKVKVVEIPLPPLETQKAIVAKLDQIFAELDQTKSEIQKNLENVDEFWKSALNQAFQGDWEMKKLGEMAEIWDWLHWTPQYEELSEYRFINWNNIKWWYINFNSAKYISENTYNKLKIDFTVWRTVFMSINWTIWNLAFYNNEKITLWKSVCYFNIKYSGLSTEYLYYYLQTNTSKNYYDNNKTWNTIMNLWLKAIREYSIPVPPISEQEKIVEHLDQVSKEVKELKSQYQSQLDNLEELKKSVLDKAFRWEM